MASSKSSRHDEDFFSNVPDIAAKVLEHLPIQIAARTSMLSRQWRRYWLSLKRLNFDADFCKEQNNGSGSCNWKECRNIISSVLFHHDGPVHEFNLYIPEESAHDGYICLSQWLSFLSKNAVKRITLCNWYDRMDVPSYMFRNCELVHLELDSFYLNPLPTGFTGFPKLQHLVLSDIELVEEEILISLIANCPVLATLKLKDCIGMYDIVIDAHNLETLAIIGRFEWLALRDVSSLKSITVCLKEMPENPVTNDMVDAFDILAKGCQLEFINFNGLFCEYLAEGMMMRPLTAAFNHLRKLCLTELYLDDPCVLQHVLGMIGSCPYIKELKISVIRSNIANQEEVDCNNNHRLDQLVVAEIKGITGSSAEMQLIKYLLAISGVLEKLVFECGDLDTESELKMAKKMMGFPRASTKAHLVSLT